MNTDASQPAAARLPIPDPGAPTHPDPPRVLTVGEYADRLNAAMHRSGPALVAGEIQEVKEFRSHVLSFTLTDGSAKLPCKWLPWEAGGRPLSHTPAVGEQVRVVVTYGSWWKEGGRGEVVVSDVRLTGEGELLAARAALLERLATEGLCDEAAFPPLPRFPTGVGLIAGVGSDAYHDVIRGLRDRFPAVPVISCCCRVQGAGAPEQIIESLIALQAHPLVDVIVIARGGGSVQDLSTFDDERLCRAIRAIGTPVVTAIGHTENNPVCNHITHAAFVPRHAAERVVPDRDELLRDVQDATDAMARSFAVLRRHAADLERVCVGLDVDRALASYRAQVLLGASAIDSRVRAYLTRGRTLVGESRIAHATAASGVRASVVRSRHELGRFADSSRRASVQSARVHRTELERCRRDASAAAVRRVAHLRAEVQSGLHVLSAADFRERGWLLATRDGRALTRVRDLEVGAEVRLHLLDGTAVATVTEIELQTREEGES